MVSAGNGKEKRRVMTRGFPVRLFLMAAFLAAALRAIIPAGYMLGEDEATGRFAIIMCSGYAPLPQAASHGAMGAMVHHDAMPDHHAGNGHKEGAHEPPSAEMGQCPFAAFSLLYTPGGHSFSLDALAFYTDFYGQPGDAQADLSHDAASPPPSRAPPALV